MAEILRDLKDLLPMDIRDTDMSSSKYIQLTVWLQAFYQVTNNLPVKDTNILHHYPQYILK